METKRNEHGHIWLDKVQAYVCPSYLNKIKTDFSDESSESFYKLYQKHYGSSTNGIKSEIRSMIFKLIEKNNYKKRNLIKALREQYPKVSSNIICRIIKNYLNLRVLEIDRTYKTKPFIIKGKYYVA
jgi:transcription elongation factor GreA-like protein